MKKLVLLSVAAIALTACSDDKEKQYQQQLQALQLQQQQFAQQQQYAPAPMQPQVIQSPAAPVVVQPQQQDNTLTNMALGAMIGHTISNMGNNNSQPVERIVEHKTVIVDNRSNTTPAPVQSLNTVTPPPASTSQAKPSSMDMNKLSESAKQTFNTGGATTQTAKPSGMDMSKMSSGYSASTSRPSVSLAKPSSSMNMSKLGRR